MKRERPFHYWTKYIFPYFFWKYCKKCKMEFKNEPGWKYTYTCGPSSISETEYVCGRCCPTHDEAEEFLTGREIT